MEVAHQPFMLQRVAGGIERIKFGHVAPRPVRRQVTEISVFAGVTGMDDMEFVVLQMRDDMYGQRIAEVFLVGHLELPADYALKELVGTYVAEFAFHFHRRALCGVGCHFMDISLWV